MNERMNDEVKLRWATQNEWTQVTDLVWRTFLVSEARECTPEGIEMFSEFVHSEELYELFCRGSYPVLLAIQGGEIVGVGSLRFETRLSLLFVEQSHWRQGIGSMLLLALARHLKEDEGRYTMSVMAAPGAVEFYKKHGFICLGAERESGGIRVTDMQKIL